MSKTKQEILTNNARVISNQWRELYENKCSQFNDLQQENRRLKALLTAADISPDAYPQEIRDRQIGRENKWFHKEEQVENLKADNAELRDTVRALTAELHAANNRTMQAVKDGEVVGI